MLQEKLQTETMKKEIERLISNINAQLNKNVDLYFVCIKDTLKKKEKV